MKRIKLGKNYSMGDRTALYLIPDAVEVDNLSYIWTERTRVYFDDVLLLTLHRVRFKSFLIISGLIFLLLLGIGIGLVSEKRDLLPVAFFFFSLAVAIAIPFMLHLIFGVDVVNVYGKRTRAQIRFSFRKQRARTIFEQLRDRIRKKQDEIKAVQDAEEAENKSTLPPDLAPPMEPPEASPPPPSSPSD